VPGAWLDTRAFTGPLQGSTLLLSLRLLPEQGAHLTFATLS
jgi:hypothetical protein